MIFFKNLQNQKNIAHGVMERKDGSVNPYSNIDSDKNVLKVLNKLGFKYNIDNLIYAEQIHEANIHIVPANLGGYIKLDVDGLISVNPNQVLITKTADCVPILFYDKNKNIAGVIHGGRKPLIKGIIPKTISILKNKFNSSAKDIIIGIGPHIRKCCYWLKEDTLKSLENSMWNKYFISKKNKVYFDLTALAIDQLKDAGVPMENIEDQEICTVDKAERFFSARKKEADTDFYKKENERFPCFGSFIGLIK